MSSGGAAREREFYLHSYLLWHFEVLSDMQCELLKLAQQRVFSTAWESSKA